MVSLVIVSHSERLAEGVKELADQMTLLLPENHVQTRDEAKKTECQAPRIVAIGGGIEDDHGCESVYEDRQEDRQIVLGTSAEQIKEAIESVWTTDGVAILADLGGSILNTTLALDLLPDDIRESCIICNAPLVEGAVAAAVEASLGCRLEEIVQAAEAARFFDKITNVS
ncbi:PTS mannose transporter subunit IID [Chloroflexi bacterium TSY]|nr:PTS mannose transporter subunit IID [Chloroflexi bacterium TSY]